METGVAPPSGKRLFTAKTIDKTVFLKGVTSQIWIWDSREKLAMLHRASIGTTYRPYPWPKHEPGKMAD